MDQRFIEKNKPHSMNMRRKVFCLFSILLILATIITVSIINRRNRIHQQQFLEKRITASESGDEIRGIGINASSADPNLGSYTVAAAELKYSLEHIQLQENMLAISGWLINLADINSNGNSYIYVNDKYYPCQSILREDVADYYGVKEYANAGFSCMIDIGQWKSTEYSITLCLINNETQIMYQVLVPEKVELK